ncbi:hypothetical protein JXB22_03655 [candidate division WOR-3 bacterium]|nr:hypothetical protein [candidate division WOR-3 bacterium]
MKQITPLFLLVFAIIACNDLPVGEDELNARGDFDIQEILLPRYSTLTEFNRYFTVGSSRNLAIGKNDDYESRILLDFAFPDTTYTGLDEIKLILRRNLNLDEDTLVFSVHLLSGAFEEAVVNWYQRTNNEWWDSAGGDFTGDSLCCVTIVHDSVVVYFNNSQFADIQAAQGIILIPQDTGFVYFNAKESGVSPEFVIIKNEDETSFALAGDAYIITGPEPFYIENWIGSGFPFRNYAKFVFDSLLLDKKAVFAELTFAVEERFAYRDTIEIGIKQLLEPIDDFNTSIGPFIALDKYALSDTLITIDVVKHVQHLIDHPDSNFGFFIILSPENYDVAYLKIRDGSHTLKVGYIEPPKERAE